MVRCIYTVPRRSGLKDRAWCILNRAWCRPGCPGVRCVVGKALRQEIDVLRAMGATRSDRLAGVLR